MKINFIFVRHGYGCHNAIYPLHDNNIISKEDAITFAGQVTDNKEMNDKLFIDPELTQIGVDASAYNGCIVSKTIRQIGFDEFKKDVFSSINIVGASPLIRSMETAHEMTKMWSVKPDKIFVFPHLRELDERSSDKFSDSSRRNLDIIPSYAMKSIPEQKKYLKSVGLDDLIDFRFVENNLTIRSEPGDISVFVEWFINTVLPKIEQVKILNVFLVTHAGVLKDFVTTNISESEGEYPFYNNTGFILSVNNKNDENQYELDKYIPLRKYLPKTFFKSYSDDKYANGKYYCPSKRCGRFCNFIKHDPNETIKKINVPYCSNSKNENLNVSDFKFKN